MIDIKNISKEEPYIVFVDEYNKALKRKQSTIEAICISTIDQTSSKVFSRMVNLKYIINNEWIFFTNYESPKACQIATNDNIAALFYWPTTKTQIRINATISKTESKFSDAHFSKRSNEKNALAISSKQSKKILSYQEVLKEYKSVFNKNNLSRPSYWGGFSFKPYYFEFWEGHESRINKRKIYELQGSAWKQHFLQP